MLVSYTILHVSNHINGIYTNNSTRFSQFFRLSMLIVIALIHFFLLAIHDLPYINTLLSLLVNGKFTAFLQL